MNNSQFDLKFPAVLETLDGKLMETGTAYVSLERQSVDFKSEFVPICKMGTPLRVVRVKDDLRLQNFVGEVYLSSQHLLRIIHVTDQVLPGFGMVGLYPTSLNGWARASLDSVSTGRLGFFHRKPKRTDQSFPVHIHAISLQKVKFTCGAELEAEQRVELSILEPVLLDRLPLVVEQAITMGGDRQNSYRCRFLLLEGANLMRLEPLVSDLSMRKNKLFPPVEPISDEAENP